jgi:hypothetical protein
MSLTANVHPCTVFIWRGMVVAFRSARQKARGKPEKTHDIKESNYITWDDDVWVCPVLTALLLS